MRAELKSYAGHRGSLLNFDSYCEYGVVEAWRFDPLCLRYFQLVVSEKLPHGVYVCVCVLMGGDDQARSEKGAVCCIYGYA